MITRLVCAPFLALALVLAAAGCSGVAKGVAGAALGGGLGGGPNVAANVQAGQNNSQVIGQSQTTEQNLVRPTARTIEQSAGETSLRTERVETVTIRKDAPVWLWLLVIAGWVLPSPGEIARHLAGLFKKGRRNAD